MTPEQELEYVSALAALDVAFEMFTGALKRHAPELAQSWAQDLQAGIQRAPHHLPPEMAQRVSVRLAELRGQLLDSSPSAAGLPH